MMCRAAQGARLATSRPRSLPHLHTNHHRDLRLRSHPPHFASTAPFPFFHLSRSKCGGLPQPPPFVLAVVCEPPFLTEQSLVWMCRQTYQMLEPLELSGSPDHLFAPSENNNSRECFPALNAVDCSLLKAI